jgi:hypothetical protein
MNKYTLRHKCLEILAAKAYYAQFENPESKNDNPTKARFIEVPIKDIITTLSVSEYEFRLAINPVAYIKEATYTQGYFTGEECLLITDIGMVSFEGRKYIKQRKEVFNEGIFLITKWLIPLATFLTALAALIISAKNCR